MRIVGSDQFLDMPISSQALYFHLGMYADDDGFVSPQKVVRITGANNDDLKVLMTKSFIIPFESGVIVITNWKENNYIQSDRYQPTLYENERKNLLCIQNVYSLDTQVRVGKVRLGKKTSTKVDDGIAENKEPPKSYGNTDVNSLLEILKDKNGGFIDGSEKENRQYCWLTLQKLKYKEDKDRAMNTVKKVIDASQESSFHSKNATSFKYLYYNLVKIVSEKKSQIKNLGVVKV